MTDTHQHARAGWPAAAHVSDAVPHPTHPVDVLLLLTDADRVLLALRKGGYGEGWWNLPSGKLEIGEDALTGIRREAAEEIGVHFDGDEPHFVATVHHRSPDDHGRIGLVFTARFDARRHRDPVNNEPDKCDALRWFRPRELPAQTLPYTVSCIAAWRSGTPLYLGGWQASGRA